MLNKIEWKIGLLIFWTQDHCKNDVDNKYFTAVFFD